MPNTDTIFQKMSQKSVAAGIVPFLLFAWSFLSALNLNISGSIAGYSSLYSLGYRLIQFFLVIKILLDIPGMKVVDFVKVIAIAIVGYLSVNTSGSSFLEAAFWFLAAAKGINYDKCIKGLLCAQLACLAITLAFFVAGAVPDSTMLRGGLVRHSLGYYHPNMLASSLLQIYLMWVYINRWGLKPLHSAVGFFLALLILLVTGSTTASSLCVVMSIIVGLYTHRNDGHPKGIIEIIVSASRYAIPLLCFVSFYSAFSGVSSLPLIGDLHGRIPQLHAYFSYYQIVPWGQELITHTSDEYTWQLGLYTLDNSYANLLLGLGWVVFICFLWLYFKEIILSLNHNDYITLAILVLYGIWGFSETTLIRIAFNFTIILFGQIIWNEYGPRGEAAFKESTFFSIYRRIS